MAMAVIDVKPSTRVPALSAPEPTAESKERQERKNAYNSREHKVNREFLALRKEGKVELWFGEHGIAGEQTITAIRSSTWTEVIDRLNCSIKAQSTLGTPSANLAQSLRDCGVEPRIEEGKATKSWRRPVAGMWELSAEESKKRRQRLHHDHDRSALRASARDARGRRRRAQRGVVLERARARCSSSPLTPTSSLSPLPFLPTVAPRELSVSSALKPSGQSLRELRRESECGTFACHEHPPQPNQSDGARRQEKLTTQRTPHHRHAPRN
eukprot:2634071-Rhodomonas_salina.1